MPCKLVIVDYGTGNLSSIKRSFSRAGADAVISGDLSDIGEADKMIMAGVGHFASGMSGLQRPGLRDVLEKAVMIDKKPVLGICLGMELMARSSEEGNCQGLGWIDADVVRFRVADKLKFKVPHIGWNSIISKKDSRLMKNIPDLSEFYFLHSYYLELADNSLLLNEADFEKPFAAAIEKDNIFGVQYHPEKSHKTGLQLLRNFVDL